MFWYAISGSVCPSLNTEHWKGSVMLMKFSLAALQVAIWPEFSMDIAIHMDHCYAEWVNDSWLMYFFNILFDRSSDIWNVAQMNTYFKLGKNIVGSCNILSAVIM